MSTPNASPACKELCEKMQMLLVGSDTDDALNALANLMIVALIQTADDVDEAEEIFETAVPVIMAGIREKWDEAKVAPSKTVSAIGRA
jgi:hypothetical protein